MTIQQQQQPPPGEPSPYLSPFYVIGAERRGETAGRFHAVVGLFENNRHFGVALCGLSANDMNIITEIGWDDVPPEQRCPDCTATA